MENFIEIAERNQAVAWDIISELQIVEAWESVGARINLVGSLKSGLLMSNRDIDFHIYTEKLDIAGSFSVIQQLAENPAVKRVEYSNLIDTEEECIEWHIWCEDKEKNLWQIDMIHIRSGSAYDGVVEKVTEGIFRLLTPKLRKVILGIKYETPPDIKIQGIEIYRAVLADGVRTLPEFLEWRRVHPHTGVFDWIPQ